MQDKENETLGKCSFSITAAVAPMLSAIRNLLSFSKAIPELGSGKWFRQKQIFKNENVAFPGQLLHI